jgi:uncharacterized protein
MVRAGNDDTSARWLVAQRWENVLFAHWPVDPKALRPLLPRNVEPDRRDGAAWLAIVAFVMVETRPLGGPAYAALAPIPELNVRTYVQVGDAPAVWFLSLDATSRFFAAIGRVLYGLRYRLSQMLVVREADCVHYLSACDAAAFAATYAPTGEAEPAVPGTLEHFLVERYRLFSNRRGRLVTAEVAHEPWPLQRAEAEISLNRMAPPGLAFSGEPLLHFCGSVEARISAPVALRSAPFRTSRMSVPPPSARSAVTVPPWDSAT